MGHQVVETCLHPTTSRTGYLFFFCHRNVFKTLGCVVPDPLPSPPDLTASSCHYWFRMNVWLILWYKLRIQATSSKAVYLKWNLGFLVRVRRCWPKGMAGSPMWDLGPVLMWDGSASSHQATWKEEGWSETWLECIKVIIWVNGSDCDCSQMNLTLKLSIWWDSKFIFISFDLSLFYLGLFHLHPEDA